MVSYLLFLCCNSLSFWPAWINPYGFAVNLNCLIGANSYIIFFLCLKLFNGSLCSLLLLDCYGFLVLLEFLIGCDLNLIACCLCSLLLPLYCKLLWTCCKWGKTCCLWLDCEIKRLCSAVFTLKGNLYCGDFSKDPFRRKASFFWTMSRSGS